ncbi:MAG TPA: imelysin family protein [Nannocystis sp.]|jgi:putative iron-regulated protein
MLAPRPRFALLALLTAAACDSSGPASPWDDAEFTAQAADVRAQYVAVVAATYADSLTSADAMQAEIEAFLAAPSAAGLDRARDAWLAAREVYGQTEVFRFYGGPIDAEPDNLEGRINSWPLDEVYIDYVEGEPEGGLINDTATYPTIDRELLIARNAAGSEDDISTGWHAIEFLLWGQDLRDDGPGERPYTDFVVGEDGTAANQDRRADYLAIATELLVADLGTLSAAWQPGSANVDSFTAGDPKDALTKLLLGMGSLSGAELSGERMGVAYETREQEDEHSCFSDNTHRDLYTNALGIENVYLGQFGGVKGASLSQLVAGLDPELDRTLREQLAASVAAMAAIPAPFDRAIQAPDGDPARQAVADGIAALKAQTATIAEVAARLEITLNLEM